MGKSKTELAQQLYDVAIGLVESGRSDIAESTYQLALELDPTDFQSITNLAVILDKSGRLEEAEKLYLKASDFPSMTPLPCLILGTCMPGLTVKSSQSLGTGVHWWQIQTTLRQWLT